MNRMHSGVNAKSGMFARNKAVLEARQFEHFMFGDSFLGDTKQVQFTAPVTGESSITGRHIVAWKT